MTETSDRDAVEQERDLEREEQKIKEHAPEERSPVDRAGDDDDPNLTDKPMPPGNPEPRG
jgi:hypothetical protein